MISIFGITYRQTNETSDKNTGIMERRRFHTQPPGVHSEPVKDILVCV